MSSGMQAAWHDVGALADLSKTGRKVVRIGGRQIALFLIGDRIHACDNRCPHEGYPLSEGHLGGESDCILTCNWHNWKFDLDSDETLVGGDRLRRYPARLEDGHILLDLTDPPKEEVAAAALENLVQCFDDHDYGRMAREVARLMKAGGDPLDGLRRAIAVAAEKLEFGATHALPAAADWLALRAETPDDPVCALAMLVESIGHFAWDSRRQPVWPYDGGVADWDEDGFVRAVEAEDEAVACAHVRGGVSAGLGWTELERGFARAALAHYADFGHAAIYTYKMRALTERLGDRDSLLHLALMLTRSLVYATREDLIPEFRAYAPVLAAWDGRGTDVSEPACLRRGSVKSVLAVLAAGSAAPEALYDAAMAAAAWQFLHFDLAWQDKTDGTLAQNVGWLDFTHALTFGNAARKLCQSYPELWPMGILQLGCFLARNGGFTDPELDVTPWRTNDPLGTAERALDSVVDHGRFEYIVSCHLLKLSYAIHEEIAERPGAPWHPDAAAALNRFLASPLKRKHTLRTAHQALDFVGAAV